MTIVAEKERLRRLAASAIAALDKDARDRANASITKILAALDAYCDSEQILAYRPLSDEVDICPLIEAAEHEGRAVFLPVVSESRGVLYRRWRRDDALVRSGLGVLEPCDGESPREVRSVVLVPGRVFSPGGWRIGRGGGYYDRALPSLAHYGTTIGIAYTCQIMPSVPHEQHDRRVDVVISENGVLS